MSAVAGQADAVGLSVSGRWSDYLQMSRPRILVMSAVAVLAGYVLASPVIDWLTAAVAVFGILFQESAPEECHNQSSPCTRCP
ncbi:hypothetical protein E3A20_09860 [Planctomyces bekefii]|uniref:Uncharacterized protein n=1 Tax=Planctomyces bekefii TaxID=1653850 RepID=A0A5C6M7A5_9PLAN|nr:hypothetical protein E3A20_09860 [Planctomyces bekefii]